MSRTPDGPASDEEVSEIAARAAVRWKDTLDLLADAGVDDRESRGTTDE